MSDPSTMKSLNARVRRLALAVLLIGAAVAGEAPTAGDADLLRRVQADLDRLYAGDKTALDVAAAVGALASDDDGARIEAGRYLAGLLRQMADDETNGRAPWHRTMWFGGGSESPARNVRAALAKQIGAEASDPAALAAIAWLLTQDPIAENEQAAVEALRRIRGDEADDLLVRVVTDGHSNGAVLAAAVEEVGIRGLGRAGEAIGRLAAHHRSAVRAAALIAAEQLGVAALPGDGGQALIAAFQAELVLIAARVPTPIPASATWKRFSWALKDSRRPTDRERQMWGWLLADDGEAYVVLTWFGSIASIPSTATVADATLSDAADELATQRESGREGQQGLSRAGGLTAQFEPGFISLPEALVAAWSFARQDVATAARVLAPRVEATADDRWLGWATRDLIGHVGHQQMLSAFCNRRDYAVALRYAQHLAQPMFDGYADQWRAKLLAQQLPERLEEFTVLGLPTPEAWTDLSRKRSRGENIAYLADRLRLLSCHQMSQPGGVEWDEPQQPPLPVTPLSGFLPTLGVWNDANAGVPLINPLAELRRLEPQPADVAVLAPYLLDGRLVPSFGFWREFHPGRTTYRVAELVAWVIDDIAQRRLCDLGALDRLDDAGRQRRVDEIIAWATAHADDTRLDLARESIASAADWREVAAAATFAATMKDDQAMTALIARCDDFDKHIDDIAEWCWRSSPGVATAAARQWLVKKEGEAPFWAALILLTQRADGQAEVLATIERFLTAHHETGWYGEAIETLLAAGDERAAAIACGFLSDPKLDQNLPFGGEALLQRLLRHGRPEAVDWIRRASEGEHAQEVMELVAACVGAPQGEATDGATRARLLDELDRQLAAARIEGAAPFPKDVDELPGRSHWRIDAP